LQAEAGQRISY